MVRCIPRSCDICPSVISVVYSILSIPPKDHTRSKFGSVPPGHSTFDLLDGIDDISSREYVEYRSSLAGDEWGSKLSRASCRQYKLKASDLSCKQSAPSQSQYNALQTASLLLYAKSNLSPQSHYAVLINPFF
jgi:hypothetical protein